MMDVYLDRAQCDAFGVPYAPAGSQLTVRADQLLSSKASGYDVQHTTYLERFGGQRLILKGIGYGWFKVVQLTLWE